MSYGEFSLWNRNVLESLELKPVSSKVTDNGTIKLNIVNRMVAEGKSCIDGDFDLMRSIVTKKLFKDIKSLKKHNFEKFFGKKMLRTSTFGNILYYKVLENVLCNREVLEFETYDHKQLNPMVAYKIYQNIDKPKETICKIAIHLFKLNDHHMYATDFEDYTNINLINFNTRLLREKLEDPMNYEFEWEPVKYGKYEVHSKMVL